MHGLAGAFCDHRIRAGRLLSEAKGFNEAGEQYYCDFWAYFANAADQFHAVHAGHAVIGDDGIEIRRQKQFQSLLAVTRDFDAVALFLEESATDQEAIRVVVNEENAGGSGGVFHLQSGRESNKIVIAMSTVLHRILKATNLALDNQGGREL